MILSDGSIRRALAEGRLIIDPIEDVQIQPASVDVRLGPEFLVFRNHTTDVIDPYDKPADLNERVRVPEGTAFVLHSGEFVLGTTVEAIGLPDDLVARVEGRAASVDSACSSTRPPASSTRAGRAARSPWSSATSPHCRSSSGPACGSGS